MAILPPDFDQAAAGLPSYLQRQGATAESTPQLQLRYTYQTLLPYLRPTTRATPGAQGATEATLRLKDYGACDIVDVQEQGVLVPFESSVLADEYGLPVPGGPGDALLNDLVPQEISPGNSMVLGPLARVGAKARYVSQIRKGDGFAEDQYGDYAFTHNGTSYPSLGVTSRHTKAPRMRALIANGLKFQTSGGPYAEPSQGLTPDDEPDRWMAINLASVGGVNQSGMRADLGDDGQGLGVYLGDGLALDSQGRIYATGVTSESIVVAGAGICTTIDSLTNHTIVSVLLASPSGLCDSPQGLSVNLASAAESVPMTGALIVPWHVPLAQHESFLQGAHAALAGEPEDANPHDPQDEAHAWWEVGHALRDTVSPLLAAGSGSASTSGSGSGSGSDSCAPVTCADRTTGHGLAKNLGPTGDQLGVFLASFSGLADGSASASGSEVPCDQSGPGLFLGGDGGEGLAVLPDTGRAICVSATGVAVCVEPQTALGFAPGSGCLALQINPAWFIVNGQNQLDLAHPLATFQPGDGITFDTMTDPTSIAAWPDEVTIGFDQFGRLTVLSTGGGGGTPSPLCCVAGTCQDPQAHLYAGTVAHWQGSPPEFPDYFYTAGTEEWVADIGGPPRVEPEAAYADAAGAGGFQEISTGDITGAYEVAYGFQFKNRISGTWGPVVDRIYTDNGNPHTDPTATWYFGFSFHPITTNIALCSDRRIVRASWSLSDESIGFLPLQDLGRIPDSAWYVHPTPAPPGATGIVWDSHDPASPCGPSIGMPDTNQDWCAGSLPIDGTSIVYNSQGQLTCTCGTTTTGTGDVVTSLKDSAGHSTQGDVTVVADVGSGLAVVIDSATKTAHLQSTMTTAGGGGGTGGTGGTSTESGVGVTSGGTAGTFCTILYDASQVAICGAPPLPIDAYGAACTFNAASCGFTDSHGAAFNPSAASPAGAIPPGTKPIWECPGATPIYSQTYGKTMYQYQVDTTGSTGGAGGQTATSATPVVNSLNGLSGNLALVVYDGLSLQLFGTEMLLGNSRPGYIGGPFRVYDSPTFGAAAFDTDGDITIHGHKLRFVPAGVPAAAPAFSLIAGSALGVGFYHGYYTVVIGGVESPASAISGTSTQPGQQAIQWSFQAEASNVTARRLYRTAVNGTAYGRVIELAGNAATTYTDAVPDSALGGLPQTPPNWSLLGGVRTGQGNDAVPTDHLEVEINGVQGFVPVFADGFSGGGFDLITLDTAPTGPSVYIQYTAPDGSQFVWAATQTHVGTQAGTGTTPGEMVPGEITPG